MNIYHTKQLTTVAFNKPPVAINSGNNKPPMTTAPMITATD